MGSISASVDYAWHSRHDSRRGSVGVGKHRLGPDFGHGRCRQFAKTGFREEAFVRPAGRHATGVPGDLEGDTALCEVARRRLEGPRDHHAATNAVHVQGGARRRILVHAGNGGSCRQDRTGEPEYGGAESARRRGHDGASHPGAAVDQSRRGLLPALHGGGCEPRLSVVEGGLQDELRRSPAGTGAESSGGVPHQGDGADAVPCRHQRERHGRECRHERSERGRVCPLDREPECPPRRCPISPRRASRCNRRSRIPRCRRRVSRRRRRRCRIRRRLWPRWTPRRPPRSIRFRRPRAGQPRRFPDAACADHAGAGATDAHCAAGPGSTGSRRAAGADHAGSRHAAD